MEIKDIKQQLSIGEVLSLYGLQPDKYHRVLCSFHPDKTPSLQLYPKTNTYLCFSSSCNAGIGDVIKFIQLIEKCSTHEYFTTNPATYHISTSQIFRVKPK
ncbi:CHC2 zinc finger domain-containing protein [Chitinophaga sancti]|uniref:CHC2 zinc finger domain-containing protein n=1 Tax=Chitinophaga sancti TaxID=1004 RepID=UPI0039BE5EF3